MRRFDLHRPRKARATPPDAAAGAMTRRRWIGAAMVTALVLFGLIGSVLAAAAADRFQDRHAAEAMDGYADDVSSSVRDEADDYAEALTDLSVAIGAQPTLTELDFAAITSRMGRVRLPGATGVGFVIPAGTAQIPAVQAYWRAHGDPGLRLRPAGPARAAGHEHMFVVLGRSFDGTPVGYGRDVAGEPEAAETLRIARETGQVTASRTFVALKDRDRPAIPGRERSLVLVTPVVGALGTTDAGRFRGWLMMGLHGNDFLGETLLDRANDVINIALVDLAIPDSPQLVARSVSGPTLADRALYRQRALSVGQRTWLLDVRPTKALKSTADRGLAPGILGLGVLITLLLGTLVAVLTGARNRALTKVDHATAALRVDIERRKVIEARLREREAELEAFAGVAAHDLKSPLFTMAGYAEVLRDDFSDSFDEDGRECLDHILSGARRMSDLIDELLTFAAARDGKLSIQQVDVGRLAVDIVAERTSGAAVRVAPDIEIVGELPTVQGDPILMHHLLDNLIGNAVKYVMPGAVPNVRIIAERAGEAAWRIEVRDRGIGIPDAQRDAVFAAFNRGTAGSDYVGTGLGLAICKRIVERHHGTIGVEPNPGGGSRFWFTLPDQPDRPDLVERPPAAPPSESGSRYVPPFIPTSTRA